MFLSGAAIPVQIMPRGMRSASELLPLTHVVQLLQGLWFGEPWSAHLLQVGVLAGMLVIRVGVSARTFRRGWSMPATLLALLLAAALPEGVIHGVVRDPMGLPVAQVSVYVAGSQLLTTTDAQGRFELTVSAPGEIRVVAFLHGYQPCELEVGPDRSRELELVLQPGAVSESVTVTAPRPIETRLVPLDLVRTPGAPADLFQGLQGFPGRAQA